jgi:hypothetical protein
VPGGQRLHFGGPSRQFALQQAAKLAQTAAGVVQVEVETALHAPIHQRAAW